MSVLKKLRYVLMPGVILGARIGGILFGLLTNIILARYLNVSDFGIVATATSIAFLAAIPMTAGVEAGSTRFMIQSLARGETRLAAGYIAYGRRTFFVMAPITVAALLVLLWLASLYRGDTIEPAVVIAIAAAPLFGILRLASSFARGMSLVLVPNIARTFFRSVFYCVAVALVVYGLHLNDPISVMAGFTASLAMTTALQYVLVRPHLAPLKAVTPDLSLKREWLVVGLQLSFASIFTEYSSNFVISIGALNLSSADIAVFNVGATIAGLASFALLSVDQVFTPQLSRAIANDNQQRVRRILALSTQLKVWGSLAGVVVILLFGERILALFGPRYLAAKSVLEILMFQAFAQALLGPGYLFLSLSRRQTSIVWASAAALAFTCIGTFVASLSGSIEAVAWVVVIAWTGLGIVLAITSRRQFGIDVTFLGSSQYIVRRLGTAGSSK